MKYKVLIILESIWKRDRIQFKVKIFISFDKFIYYSIAWIIDLKNGDGCVTVGTLPTADASFFMSDDDFVELCYGNLDP